MCGDQGLIRLIINEGVHGILALEFKDRDIGGEPSQSGKGQAHPLFCQTSYRAGPQLAMQHNQLQVSVPLDSIIDRHV